tara:strand:+ start:94703 stop:95680 length:978 start_codon:yes stop_codon:yes gene_type:complete
VINKIAFIGGFDRLYDEEGKAKSFEALGYEVGRFKEVGFNEQSFKDLIAFKPDMVMSPKYGINPEILVQLFQYCKEEGVITTAWHPDLYHYGPNIAGENRMRMVANRIGLWGCDFVFSPDGGLDSKRFYDSCNVNHHLIRQAPYHETVGHNTSADISHITTKEVVPILFVGSSYQIPDEFRAYMITSLRNRYGNDFLWLGKGEHDVREEELSTLIARTKVVIGDSFYFPGYWSNRIYETIGRGGLCVHPYVPGIEDEFTPRKHCEFFPRWNFNELFRTIDYYLKPENEEERQSIISLGMDHIRENHTLLNRCRDLMWIIESNHGV